LVFSVDNKEQESIKSIDLELSFTKTSKEPLPDQMHRATQADNVAVLSPSAEKLPLQVVSNTGATTSELYQECMMVTPDEETFSTNYGAPEIIFGHIEGRNFNLQQIVFKSAINKTNKGFPVSEGLIFTSNSLQDLGQAKLFSKFKKADYEKWLEQKGNAQIMDHEPVAYFDVEEKL
jgi:hypothetical protein